MEIREDFLPEPLILTILLDCRTSTHACYHLTIEKNPKLSDNESKLLQFLFGGKKGYYWLASFLGLMQTISYTQKIPIKKELIITQYRLKLLTILANILTSNLLDYDKVMTSNFVKTLIKHLNGEGDFT